MSDENYIPATTPDRPIPAHIAGESFTASKLRHIEAGLTPLDRSQWANALQVKE